jgi:hypothetical protein
LKKVLCFLLVLFSRPICSQDFYDEDVPELRYHSPDEDYYSGDDCGGDSHYYMAPSDPSPDQKDCLDDPECKKAKEELDRNVGEVIGIE